MWPAVLTLLLFARAATACSCFSSPECEGLGSNSSPAFRGTVLSVSDLPQTRGEEPKFLASRVARFRIEESFGGLAPGTREVEVLTGSGGGDCGIPFEPGEQYLVYANIAKSDGRLHTGVCSGTRDVDSAGTALRVLRQRLARQPIPSLAGRIAQRNPDFRDQRREQPLQPLGGALIRLQAAGKTFETRSDADGFYSFYDLPGGRYEIEPDLPPAIKPAWSHGPPLPVELGRSGCREQNLNLFPSGSIEGRVIDTFSNLLLPHAFLYLVPASGDPLPPSDRLHRTSQRDGNYRFNKVPPGAYQIVVNPDSERDPDFPYARVSRSVTLHAGEQVTGVDLRLPPLFVPRRLQVRVTWANGRLAGDLASVDARAVKGPQILAQLEYPNATKGVFEVKLVPGESYVMKGEVICRYSDERGSGPGAEFESSPYLFAADDTRAELTLTLPVNGCPAIPGKTLENAEQ